MICFYLFLLVFLNVLLFFLTVSFVFIGFPNVLIVPGVRADFPLRVCVLVVSLTTETLL